MTSRKPNCAIREGDKEESPPNIPPDEFDELLEASSLGSPKAKKIRELTPPAERRRFEEWLDSQQQDKSPVCDIDDAVYELVKLCGALGGDATSSDDYLTPSPRDVWPDQDCLEISQIYAQLQPKWDFFARYARGFTHVESHMQYEDDDVVTRRLMTRWLLCDLARTRGGPARMLQYLVDEDAVSGVREDVARAIVSVTFAHIDTAPWVVRSACAAVLSDIHISDEMVFCLSENGNISTTSKSPTLTSAALLRQSKAHLVYTRKQGARRPLLVRLERLANRSAHINRLDYSRFPSAIESGVAAEIAGKVHVDNISIRLRRRSIVSIAHISSMSDLLLRTAALITGLVTVVAFLVAVVR